MRSHLTTTMAAISDPDIVTALRSAPKAATVERCAQRASEE